MFAKLLTELILVATVFTLVIEPPTKLTLVIALATTSISEDASFKSLATVSISDTVSSKSSATFLTLTMSVATVLTLAMLVATVVMLALFPAAVVTLDAIPATVVVFAEIPATVVTFALIPATVALNDLTTVDVASPTNGQHLVYNTTSSKWEAAEDNSVAMAIALG